MDLHLPVIPQFDTNDDPSSLGQHWNKWKKCFEYYLQAAAITDKARQRALLLHLVGPETQKIFETFSETGNDLKTALTKLDNYFSPKNIIPLERHKFHEARQEPEENTDAFVTRLRKLAKYCDFGVSLNDHVRDMVISKCRSTKFGKRLLAESDVAIEKALEIGRLMENADRQSQDIEASNGSSSRSGVAYPVNKGYKSKASGGTIKRNYPARQSSSVNSQVKSCYCCDRPGHLATDCTVTKGKKCNSCEKVGHFAKTCKTKPQGSGKINVVAHEEFEEHSTDIEEARNLYVC